LREGGKIDNRNRPD